MQINFAIYEYDFECGWRDILITCDFFGISDFGRLFIDKTNWYSLDMYLWIAHFHHIFTIMHSIALQYRSISPNKRYIDLEYPIHSKSVSSKCQDIDANPSDPQTKWVIRWEKKSCCYHSLQFFILFAKNMEFFASINKLGGCIFCMVHFI